jgi:hypothetical protein
MDSDERISCAQHWLGRILINKLFRAALPMESNRFHLLFSFVASTVAVIPHQRNHENSGFSSLARAMIKSRAVYGFELLASAHR